MLPGFLVESSFLEPRGVICSPCLENHETWGTAHPASVPCKGKRTRISAPHKALPLMSGRSAAYSTARAAVSITSATASGCEM